MSSTGGYDRHITIFSPEGRLYQVEYAFKAIRLAGVTTIGVRGSDSVCVVTQKKVTDKLIVPSTVTSMFRITNTIGCCLTGRRSDMLLIVQRLRHVAQEFEFKYGFVIPVSYLSQRIGDLSQLRTQYAFQRPAALSIVLFGIDEEYGPQLFRCDPAGYQVGYKALCTGQKEQEGTNSLEKKIKQKSDLNTKETIELAISTLQRVLNTDFKPDEIEVSLVTTENPKFKVLQDLEVEEILNEIAENEF
ncbi:proteasome subunit alpha type-6 [Anaeramoeba flamelloides]|uniref:Proteasome subunit alpha type n=1 Tax=Anaeramoeba flamelloides TaxID=1746091 RepID=A0AAV7Y5W3_9EUKA|nr:proteasome subunit alpha type-6 [Anaeramoeba flamelloides]KAJ3430048.1 proteasome subunit alpha type-6 [Anaeramoeba flamelloides]KAJ6230301.1 proteasome subunit alpha type-6 [Anaeramoeba flamelloides]KAJ6235242.1 proteasome subunit alpha type-6 [Anaeramoeba flamelloides]KAJ6239188.1 proteasome subunit alpha type-6 [Anaeramoeba flamelloides]